jgi:hypothetical protein
MAGGFSVAIGSDTRLFEQGIKTGVIEPVEDAQDALQDLAKAGEKTGDSSRSLDKLGKAGKDAGEDIQDGARKGDKALDQLGKSGKDAGSDLEAGLKGAQSETAQTTADYKEMTAKIQAETAKLKASGKESFTPAAESSRAFKDEATANLSEVASSFNGDAQSITDLFQGTLGGIITELGPLGLAVGTAAAVGIGLIGAAFSQSGEDAQAFQDRVDSMTGEILSDFTDTGDAVSAIDKKLREWATDNEKYGVSLVQLRKDAQSAGVGFDDLATTIAGGTTKQLRGMRSEINDTIDSLSKQAAAVDTTAGADRSAADAAQAKVKQLNSDVIPAINQQIKANENAKAAEEALAAANDMTIAQYRKYVDAQNEASEASQSFADGVQSAYEDAGSNIDDFVKDGVFNLDAYNAQMENSAKAITQYQTNVATASQTLSAQALEYVESLGPKAAPALQAFVDAPLDQKQRTAANWDVLGSASADSYNKKLQGDLDAVPATKTVKVKVDRTELDNVIADAGKTLTKSIKVLANLGTKTNP